MNLKVISYNSRGLPLGHSTADKAKRIVVDKLLKNVDIVCVQETFLSKQHLDQLNSVNDDSLGVGESITSVGQ